MNIQFTNEWSACKHRSVARSWASSTELCIGSAGGPCQSRQAVPQYCGLLWKSTHDCKKTQTQCSSDQHPKLPKLRVCIESSYLGQSAEQYGTGMPHVIPRHRHCHLHILSMFATANQGWVPSGQYTRIHAQCRPPRHILLSNSPVPLLKIGFIHHCCNNVIGACALQYSSTPAGWPLGLICWRWLSCIPHAIPCCS